MTIPVALPRTKHLIYLPRVVNNTMEDNTIENNITKYENDLFELKKENEAIKDRIISDIRTIFKSKKDNYHKPVRFGKFF